MIYVLSMVLVMAREQNKRNLSVLTPHISVWQPNLTPVPFLGNRDEMHCLPGLAVYFICQA